MPVVVADIQHWLKSLCEDDFPEDTIAAGDPAKPVERVLTCWYPNRAVRQAARDFRADLIVMHEVHVLDQPRQDPGCPHADDWPVNQESLAFFEETGMALIRSHRTQDCFSIPYVLAARLQLGAPVVASGWKGYEFTQVYEVAPVAFGELATRFKERLGQTTVRVSPGWNGRQVSRLGLGWGGISHYRNLQYVELLREAGAEVIVAGEVDEYAIEYYRDAGLGWIELGHYATEVLGMEHLAHVLAAHFPGLTTTCWLERGPRVEFC
jgi:putative NIF3 family GTP cyclohydrolase 1 type 2